MPSRHDAGSPDEDFYPLHAAVQRVGLGVMKVSSGLGEALWNNLVRLKQLRDAIRLSRPDVVISFIERTNVLVLLSTIGLPVPIVACERIDPRHHSIGPVWTWLRRCLYRRAASLVVQTEGLRSWAEGFVPARSVHVIPNPIATVSEEAAAERATWKSKCVSALGRLVPQKGFDTLLQAFAQCLRTHADWSPTIIGEGPRSHQSSRPDWASEIASMTAADPTLSIPNGSVCVVFRHEGFDGAG